MSKLSKTITEKEKRNILAWTDVLGIKMTSCTCYQSHLIGEAVLLAQTLALVHHPGGIVTSDPVYWLNWKRSAAYEWKDGPLFSSLYIHSGPFRFWQGTLLTSPPMPLDGCHRRKIEPILSLVLDWHSYQSAGMCASNVCMKGQAGWSRNKKGKLISE